MSIRFSLLTFEMTTQEKATKPKDKSKPLSRQPGTSSRKATITDAFWGSLSKIVDMFCG